MFWEDLRTDEFDEAIEKSKGVCILPIGCLESHGIHMPLGCDVMHVTEVCRRASEKEYVTIFPPLYFGEKSDGKSTGVFADFSKHKIWSPYIWIANHPNYLCAEYHPGLNERIAKAMGEKRVSIAVDTFKFLKEETISQNFVKEWRAKYFK